MKKDIKITHKRDGVPFNDKETYISVKNIPTKLVVVSNGISYPIEECEFFTNGVLHTSIKEEIFEDDNGFELRKVVKETFLTDWSVHFSNFTFTSGVYKQ